MLAYSKKAKMREARKEALTEMEICSEHYDLVLLTTLHEEYHHTAEWLRKFYRKFVAKYKYYMNRYLTADDSTKYGDRTDAYAMKKYLKEIGFDYDAECEAMLREFEQERNKERG